MKTIKKISLIVLGIIALFFVISVFLPSVNKVERSISFKGNADSVFNNINTLKNWNKWSHWQLIEPTIQIQYYGPTSGVGATQHWSGKDGKGKLTIVESIAPRLVAYQLQFEDFTPMNGYVEIDANADSSITVHWVMKADAGKNPLMKYFGLMMDPMMGPDFEAGLKNLSVLINN
jgi:Polyketide cyclase / dehydrase and lipid transport